MRFRMLMIAAGYEDGNDADRLRNDPMFKLAMGRLPDDAALCSQPTLSRLENLPRRAHCCAWPGYGGALIARVSARCRGASCSTSTTPSMPSMAASSSACSTPTTMNTASSRSSCSTARAARRSHAAPGQAADRRRARKFLRRLVREIRGHWPRVEILLRADSHYCTPEVLGFCRAARIDFILGVATTTTLRRHVAALEASTARRHPARRARKAAPLQGILRRRRQLGPRRAHHRPRRRLDRRASTHASSSPTWPAERRARSTRISTARAVRRRIISRRGRDISRPIARRAAARPPTSSA